MGIGHKDKSGKFHPHNNSRGIRSTDFDDTTHSEISVADLEQFADMKKNKSARDWWDDIDYNEKWNYLFLHSNGDVANNYSRVEYDELPENIKDIVNLQGKFRCENCGELFDNSHDISVHQRQEKPDKYFSDKEFREIVKTLPSALGNPDAKIPIIKTDYEDSESLV